MRAVEVALVVLAAFSVISSLLLVATVAAMLGALRRTKLAVAELAAMTEPLVASVEEVRAAALAEVSRASELVSGAEASMAQLDETLSASAAVQRRMEDASRLAVAAVGGPLVKLVAVRAGGASAWKRLKRKGRV